MQYKLKRDSRITALLHLAMYQAFHREARGGSELPGRITGFDGLKQH